MKSILMIGMGRFGSHLCKNLSKLDNEIMIVDSEEEKLEDLLPYVTSAKIGTAPMKKFWKALAFPTLTCVLCPLGTIFRAVWRLQAS